MVGKVGRLWSPISWLLLSTALVVTRDREETMLGPDRHKEATGPAQRLDGPHLTFLIAA